MVPSQELSINAPILSLITDVSGPSRGDPLNVTASLDHRALVDRVNQVLLSFYYNKKSILYLVLFRILSEWLKFLLPSQLSFLFKIL